MGLELYREYIPGLVDCCLFIVMMSFTGSLPSPESITINSSAIQWNDPYYAMNSESNFMHVNPHIIHYTIYIVDNYTGNYIDKANVTERSFTLGSIAPDDCLYPVYGVSAWNSGGEGEMSEPLPEYLPHSKLYNILQQFWHILEGGNRNDIS